MIYNNSNLIAGGAYVSPSIDVSTVYVEAGFSASREYVSSDGNDIDDVAETYYGTF